MNTPQPAILAPLPPFGRFLTFALAHEADARSALAQLARQSIDDAWVVGLGAPLVRAVTGDIPGLRPFPSLAGANVSIPSTQGALWAFVGGTDAGDTLHAARRLSDGLGESFRIDEDLLAFQYAGGRDLTGYEDGTENPKDDAAERAAIASGFGEGLDGSSFVATQRWEHDLRAFEKRSPEARDHVFGRHRIENDEIDDAPISAHVKRAAQETFDPPAFMLRRSMPWGDVGNHGLYFVAYGHSLDAFERVLTRMVGLEDGTVDALFSFSRPRTGGYFWCPPKRGEHLDLRALAK